VTWTRTLATGSGKLSFRLQIAGFPYELVTRAAMETTAADGRIRKTGLSLRGVKLSQKADLVRAQIEATGATFTVADCGEAITAAFETSPTAVTWLNSDATSSATTLTVKSTSGFPSSGALYVDSEVITYSGTTATTFTGCTRGVWNTLAQAHYVPDGAFLRAPEITNKPTVIEGRRVRLYVYGAGDSPTGDGTQIWLGILRSEPRMEGPAWSFSVDPISSLLDQEVGADLGPPVTPRGVYLPRNETGMATYVLRISRLANVGGATSSALPELTLGTNNVELSGHYETQAEFIAALQAAIDAVQSSWNTKIYVREHAPTGSYYFELRTGATPDGIRISLNVPLTLPFEPVFDGLMQASAGTAGVYDPSSSVSTFAQNADYFCFPAALPMAGSGQVPRGFFNSLSRDATYPANRLYLGGSVAVSDNTDAALIQWQSPTSGTVDLEYQALAIDTADRNITLSQPSAFVSPRTTYHFTPSNLPTIRLGRRYNDYLGDGTYSLLKTIEDDCAVQLNTGAIPSWESGDWNSTAWLDAYNDGSVLAVAAQRSYSSLKPVKLKDFVCPDLQLASLYLAFDSNGKLTVKPLRLASPTETGTFAITKANLLTDEGFPQYERGAVGQYNTLEIHDGYSATTDEYTLLPIRVRDVAAFGRSPLGRSVKIETKSAPYASVMSPSDAVLLGQRVLGIFGSPYAFVTCSVPLTGFTDTTLGSTVSLTTTQLPDSTGVRGVTDLVGIVTAREIDLYAARIQLTVLVSRARISGYAFGAMVSSQSNTSGNTWAITVSNSSDYFASGDTAEDHVDASDRVMVYRFDSATAGTVAGTVQSVSGNVVTVTFDGVWTPGADQWTLAFTDADQGNDTENMNRYCFQAGSTAVIDWDISDDQPARQFAP